MSKRDELLKQLSEWKALDTFTSQEDVDYAQQRIAKLTAEIRQTDKACERCEKVPGAPHDLVVWVYSTDEQHKETITFRLCDKCYHYGLEVEPITDIEGFLHVLETPEQPQ